MAWYDDEEERRRQEELERLTVPLRMGIQGPIPTSTPTDFDQGEQAFGPDQAPMDYAQAQAASPAVAPQAYSAAPPAQPGPLWINTLRGTQPGYVQVGDYPQAPPGAFGQPPEYVARPNAPRLNLADVVAPALQGILGLSQQSMQLIDAQMKNSMTPQERRQFQMYQDGLRTTTEAFHNGNISEATWLQSQQIINDRMAPWKEKARAQAFLGEAARQHAFNQAAAQSLVQDRERADNLGGRQPIYSADRSMVRNTAGDWGAAPPNREQLAQQHLLEQMTRSMDYVDKFMREEETRANSIEGQAAGATLPWTPQNRVQYRENFLREREDSARRLLGLPPREGGSAPVPPPAAGPTAGWPTMPPPDANRQLRDQFQRDARALTDFPNRPPEGSNAATQSQHAAIALARLAGPQTIPSNEQAANALNQLHIRVTGLGQQPEHRSLMPGPTATSLMTGILDRAVRANRDLTDEERDRYNQAYQRLVDSGQLSDNQRRGLQLPGGAPQYYSNPNRLNELRTIAENATSFWRLDGPAVRGAVNSIDRILQHATQANRGLTPLEKAQYEAHLRVLNENRESYGRLHDQLMLR